MKSMKEIYNLSYDTSNFNSGLVNWYNQMIDKTYEELNSTDVSKMIRQNILKEVAEKKIIELFVKDPYDGEFNDGGLLKIIISLNFKAEDIQDFEKFRNFLIQTKNEYEKFDWSDEQTKIEYGNNITKLMNQLGIKI
ncbi:MAG: hypothetical protein KBF12_13775 [Sebaldella sp.]|nr:hypothetical protein [Sebaldella sp.]